MFEKERRYTFKKGLPKKIFSCSYFTIRYGKMEGNLAKRAVVVSKKVSKKAVVRNKIKRKVLSYLEEYLGDQTFDVVVYIKPALNDVKEEKIESVIKDAIIKKIKWEQ